MITIKHGLCQSRRRGHPGKPTAAGTLALGLLCGILLTQAGWQKWIPACGAAALIAAPLAGPRRLRRLRDTPRGRLAAVFISAAVLGGLRAGADVRAARPGAIQSHIWEAEDAVTLHLRGAVAGEPHRVSRSSVSLLVCVGAFRFDERDNWHDAQKECVELLVYTRRSKNQSGDIAEDRPELTVPTACGAVIEAEARPASQPRTCHDRGRSWLLHDPTPVQARTYWKKARVLVDAPSYHPAHALRRWKTAMLDVYRRSLPDPVYRLAAGAALGDRGPVRFGEFKGRTIRNLFAHAGVSHVLAVSGLHVGIVTGTLMGLLRLVRLPPRWTVIPVGMALSGMALFEAAHAGASVFSYPEINPLPPMLLPVYYAVVLIVMHRRRLPKLAWPAVAIAAQIVPARLRATHRIGGPRP